MKLYLLGKGISFTIVGSDEVYQLLAIDDIHARCRNGTGYVVHMSSLVEVTPCPEFKDGD